MADKLQKNPGNVPGNWYVDSSCIDCDLCRGNAPGIFDRDADLGMSIVIRQPVSPGDVALATEAMEGCPSDSIGNDGQL